VLPAHQPAKFSGRSRQPLISDATYSEPRPAASPHCNAHAERLGPRRLFVGRVCADRRLRSRSELAGLLQASAQIIHSCARPGCNLCSSPAEGFSGFQGPLLSPVAVLAWTVGDLLVPWSQDRSCIFTSSCSDDARGDPLLAKYTQVVGNRLSPGHRGFARSSSDCRCRSPLWSGMAVRVELARCARLGAEGLP